MGYLLVVNQSKTGILDLVKIISVTTYDDYDARSQACEVELLQRAEDIPVTLGSQANCVETNCVEVLINY